MDVDSSDDGCGEISDLLNEDGAILAGELGLDFFANKEGTVEDYGFEDLVRGSNEFNIDMNEQGKQGSPLLHSDFGYYEISGCPSNMYSPLQNGFDQDVALNETKFVCDQDERIQSPPPAKDNHQQDVTGELCGSYPRKSSPHVEVETITHVLETGVSAHSQEFLSVEANDQEQEMAHRPSSSPEDESLKCSFSETLPYELIKAEFAYDELEEDVPNLQTDNFYSSPRWEYGKDETENEKMYSSSRSHHDEGTKLGMPHSEQQHNHKRSSGPKSPGTERQHSVSPDMSPSNRVQESLQCPRDGILNSSVSHGQEHCSSPETSVLGEEVPSKDHSPCDDDRQNFDSPPLWSRIKSHQINGGPEKHASLSSRSHNSNQCRRKRSVSRSPLRRRDSSSEYNRDRHNRSRSRSPVRKDHYRRSPRERRYSARCRSPPSGYHSHRRSPRRRHWSPPHNRSTGVGKPGRNLFVAGFSFMTTERDLERKFSRFGRVRDVRIVRDKRSGDSRGFGFLSLQRDEEADAAIRALDKTEWNGRIVLVEKSKSH